MERSEAYAVNDKGQVTGCYWVEGNNFILFGIMKSPSSTSLQHQRLYLSIIIAISLENYINAEGFERGFVWNKLKGFQDIGSLGGSTKITRISDMNNLGHIVGESQTHVKSQIDGKESLHGFVWIEGIMTDLSTLGEKSGIKGDQSRASGINDLGQIVGFSNAIIKSKKSFKRTSIKAVIWQDGVLKEIDPTFESTSDSKAFSINNAGMITFEKTDSEGDSLFVMDYQTLISHRIYSPCDSYAEINDRGDIFIYQAYRAGFEQKTATWILLKDKIRTINENDENFHHAGEFFNAALKSRGPKKWSPNSFIKVTGYNNFGLMVGSAMNSKGNQQAVLLVPQILLK